MLVLRRKAGEKVEISTDGKVVCVVEVVDIRGDMIVIGFDADKSVKIMRPEAKAKEPK